MDKMYEALGTIIGTMVIFLLSSPVIKKIKNSRTRNGFGKRLEVDDEINKVLFELRSTYGFNRASLIEYHNGTTSLAGFGFKNATMRNESTDEITKPIILDFQNIPCSLVASMLVDLEKSPKGYVVIGDDYHDDVIKITHRMYGVKEEWNFRLGGSLVDGCVSLISTGDNISLSNEDILDIKAKCQRILLLKKGFLH